MHAVVTGANRGIGLELTRQLAAQGATVEATARDPDAASELRALAAASAGRIRVHRVDVASDPSVLAFAAALGDAPLDLVINNAGIMGQMASLEDLDLADAARTSIAQAVPPRDAISAGGPCTHGPGSPASPRRSSGRRRRGAR